MFSATLSLPLPNIRKAADSVRVLSARRMRQGVNSQLPLDSQSEPSLAADSFGAIVTGMKQSFRMLSFRNLCRLEFVQSMTDIRLGTGRGFRYAYSQQLPSVFCTPFGARPQAREDAFVEASSPLA